MHEYHSNFDAYISTIKYNQLDFTIYQNQKKNNGRKKGEKKKKKTGNGSHEPTSISVSLVSLEYSQQFAKKIK